ncbi:unnamed protein product [Rotaria sordida]|uniref:ABC transmembrane type-1 domain-containing protein n=2 Tax=Rotaria sordida TaxID=392033 RepID=A0A819CXP8_9BILA|nr:unnamed protein product [Rotaria sordida]CAF3896239.1 unnamed protein product [Rotaria sordida]
MTISAERQTRTIRQTLFQSILKKDIVFFDTHTPGELNLQLTDNMNKIHDGIDDKLGTAVELISTCIGALIIGWKLTLVVLSCSPIIVGFFILSSKITTRLTTNEMNAYGKAGAVAEEVISSIRTVLSYNGQEREIKRFV